MLGGSRFSEGLKESVIAVSELPSAVKKILNLAEKYLQPNPGTNIYFNYREFSALQRDLNGFIMIPFFDSYSASSVLLINLTNNASAIIKLGERFYQPAEYSDFLIGSEKHRQPSLSCQNRICSPYLSKDGMLTYLIHLNDIVTIDLATGKERWRVKGAFHHSIEPDADGNMWVCGAVQPGSLSNNTTKFNHSNKSFGDQALVRISKAGKILNTISIADLLCNSGLEYLLYGVSNPNTISDPIHLNQITPILSDSGVFKTGQILVSLRNMSTVILVDPVAPLVIWHRSGSWMNQHSVFPVGPSQFTVLDNHSFASGEFWLNKNWHTKIVECNIETGKQREIKISKEYPLDFNIPIEGRLLPIKPETWVVEDCHKGTIMIFQNQKLVFKWTNLFSDGTVGVTSWCRYIPENMFPKIMSESVRFMELPCSNLNSN